MSHRKLVLSVSSSGRANGNFIFKNNKLIGLKATEMYVRKRVQVQTVDNSDNDYTANVWIWHTFESFVTREKKSNGANFTEKHHRAKNNTTSFQRGFSFVRIFLSWSSSFGRNLKGTFRSELNFFHLWMLSPLASRTRDLPKFDEK